MSSSLMRLAQIGYALALLLILCLVFLPNSSQAQVGFGVSTGYRASPGLPTIAIAIPNISASGTSAAGAGGATGFGGAVGGTSATGSFSPIPIIYHVNLGQFFPNNGQIIGLPPPTLMPPLSNFYYGFLFENSTGAPWATITALSLGGGVGIGGGIGGAIGGVGGGIAGSSGGGFAGKGMGGFNGKKPL
jgi:hypothetical protein